MVAMTRPRIIIAAVAFLCSAAAATSPPVTFESPCSCRDNHGEHRWAVKNDPSTPLVDAGAIQAVTPSDVFSWPGPDVRITWQSERTGIENKWFALIGRVVAVQVEADGDLHIALGSATGDKPGIVVCEVPAGSTWCEFATSFSVGRERNSPCTFDRGEVTVAEGVGVIIDSKGHLGTVVSSQRFKDEIKPMDKASEAILALKPVTFHYTHE